MSGQHARLAPSAAHQWRYCAGMLTLAAAYPEDENSPEAMEGEAAHWLAAQTITSGNKACFPAVGSPAPNGVAITRAMVEGAEMYLEAVMGWNAAMSALHVEERLLCASIHAECWGTPDVWAFANGILDVGDYKFGHGYVDVYENPQLICYAAGALDEIRTRYDVPATMPVRLHVIQPRSYHRDGHVRTWETTVAGLQPYFEELRHAAALAVQPTTRTRVGPWCRHCPAARGCEALAATAYEAIDVAGSSVPFDLTAKQAGCELRTLRYAKEALSARIEGIEAQAIAQIRAGQYVPYFHLSEARTNLAWNVPVEDVLALGEMLEVPLAKPPQPITPTQAIKLVGADVVMQFASRPRGEIKLVPADVSQAQKVFSK
jgi:hypothetical protein